jgi:cytoskeletal protein CcmA (bactofilin family)
VSIIGQGTTIQGEVKSEGTIRIEGVVAGRIQCGDTIVVQETGHVKADMVANQVVISGEVHGNVFAHERLEITPTGKVVGDITAPRISIAEGVLFEGKCTMKPPGQMKPPSFAGDGGAQTGEKPASAAPKAS